MVSVRFIVIGSLKESYLRQACAEYEKRLGGFCRFETVQLKEEKLSDSPSESEIKNALEREAAAIERQIPPRAYRIAMCVEGKEYDSPSLAKILGEAADQKGRIALIIGSSHGLSSKVKCECDSRLSLSKLTFPHQLMRVILFEAIYRSFTIIAGKKYHK